MRAPLRIAVAQPPTTAHAVDVNVREHAEAVRRSAARVVVFPELSLTGYELDAAALDPRDDRLLPLVAACRAAGSLALAGAPVRDDDGREYIAVLAVDGDGARCAYRKMWLGDEEALRFTAGPQPVVLDVGGWRLGLAVCKDTGVEQHARATAALGIDAYVAGTVKHDHESGLQDERARRIATGLGVWVAVASAAGPTGGGYERTAGRSAVWAAGGAVVARADDHPGGLALATVG